jgi:hypothetical protein
VTKNIHTENYKGFDIIINGEFKHNVYDFVNGYTDAVYLYYYVYDDKSIELLLKDNIYHQAKVVYKDLPTKFLFWTFYPKETFEQKVKREIDDLIHYIKSEIDQHLYEKEITDGLLDSLKTIE